jgi:pantetheine-phosphate adenylyltransferase
MTKIAVFPGSFDPITVGHQSVIQRALPLFDRIVIAVGLNATKSTMFDVEQRMQWIRECFPNEAKIEVQSFSGLTVEFCKSVGAKYILRGLRTSADFEFERSIGQVNKLLEDNIETVFLLTSTLHTPISSSIARDIIRHKGNLIPFVPEVVAHEIMSQYERLK